MKFCEDNPMGLLHTMLSYQDMHENSGLSYLHADGFDYTEDPGEADFFVSINGKTSTKFPLSRTILIVTEPYSRFKKRYEKKFRNAFGGFMGINRDKVFSDDEFYFPPQDFTGIQPLKENPDFDLVMIHQRYKKEYRNLLGDAEREKAVTFFDTIFGENFHTYGRVWKKTRPWFNAGWKGVLKGPYMGSEKLQTMSNYKFTLCIENSRECGYVTEKIFSAFFAGSIPLYFGAVDIADHIPSDCYIEFDGKDYPALAERIKSMGEQEFQAMRNRARNFITSHDCEPFTSIGLAQKLKTQFLKLESMPTNLWHPRNLWGKTQLVKAKLKLKAGVN